MSGHPQGGHYDDGYSHPAQGQDAYYHDDQSQGYYDHHEDYQQQQQHGGGDAYYDDKYEKLFTCSNGGEVADFNSAYYNADAQGPYQHEGGYYDGNQQGYQDEYYNDQYYDQGAPAAGQQPHYGQNGYGYV